MGRIKPLLTMIAKAGPGKIFTEKGIMKTENAQGITLAEEIKALLILLLLKGGTRGEEIQMALQLAGGEMIFNSSTTDTLCPLVQSKVAAMTPKQKVRNAQLAPLKCYAA